MFVLVPRQGTLFRKRLITLIAAELPFGLLLVPEHRTTQTLHDQLRGFPLGVHLVVDAFLSGIAIFGPAPLIRARAQVRHPIADHLADVL